jgi:hypothetical protein
MVSLFLLFAFIAMASAVGCLIGVLIYKLCEWIGGR